MYSYLDKPILYIKEKNIFKQDKHEVVRPFALQEACALFVSACSLVGKPSPRQYINSRQNLSLHSSGVSMLPSQVAYSCGSLGMKRMDLPVVTSTAPKKSGSKTPKACKKDVCH